MTEEEKKYIDSINSKGINMIYADEIGELMEHATNIEGSDKIGNVLFDAITRAFALGYFRGSKEEK